MIRLTKGEINFIYISLRDKRLTNSNIYNFKFVNEVTSDEIELQGTDESLHPDRYSEFEVPLELFEDAEAGFWRYYVTQTGSGDTIIATGKAELVTTGANITRYEGYDGSFKAYTL